MKTSNILLWVVVALVTGVVGWMGLITFRSLPLGSVTAGNEYNATSTSVDDNMVDGLVRQGQGTLGSAIVTGAGTQEVWILNATTSLANMKEATSTVLLGVLPASLAAGTYTFDTSYTTGLYLDVMVSGTGTTTITYR